jgi:hypothetical protein
VPKTVNAEDVEVKEGNEGEDIEEIVNGAVASVAQKSMIRKLSFDDMKRKKRKANRNGIILVSPEEVDIDPEDDELDINRGDSVGLHFRPMTPKDDAEIREIVKDFPVEGGAWEMEYNDELLMRCLIDPVIPQTAEGRRLLQEWLPGTRASVALAIQNQSGMGRHIVRNASVELGNLRALTKD